MFNIFFMQDLKELEHSEIYDLLAAHTMKYTKMLLTGMASIEEFSHTKEMIEKLQLEIEFRNLKDESGADGYPEGLTPSIA